MASQSEDERRLRAAAAKVISEAPWQSGSADSTTESLTQPLVAALRDARGRVNDLTAAPKDQTGHTMEEALGGLAGLVGGQDEAGSEVSGGGVAESILSGGSVLSPILDGIIGLFGSDSSNAPPPLIPFAMPAPINIDATGGQVSGGSLAGSDYGGNGLPRAQTTSQRASNVNVQVNANDSRSFLDRSKDIATAVRQAILSSHAINDVLSEL